MKGYAQNNNNGQDYSRNGNSFSSEKLCKNVNSNSLSEMEFIDIGQFGNNIYIQFDSENVSEYCVDVQKEMSNKVKSDSKFEPTPKPKSLKNLIQSLKNINDKNSKSFVHKKKFSKSLSTVKWRNKSFDFIYPQQNSCSQTKGILNSS